MISGLNEAMSGTAQKRDDQEGGKKKQPLKYIFLICSSHTSQTSKQRFLLL